MKPENETSKRGESKYAKKRASGNMMYGPGCCGHTVSEEQLVRARRAAYDEQRIARFNALVKRYEGDRA